MKGYIYLFKCEDFYKIGKSMDCNFRMSTLQMSSPFEIKFIAAGLFDDFSKKEKELHSKYNKYHTRGEWFLLPTNIALEIEKELIENDGSKNIKSLVKNPSGRNAKTKFVTLVFRLTEDEYKKIEIYAAQNNQNRSEAVRSLIKSTPVFGP